MIFLVEEKFLRQDDPSLFIGLKEIIMFFQ